MPGEWYGSEELILMFSDVIMLHIIHIKSIFVDNIPHLL